MQIKIFRVNAAKSEIIGSWHDGPKAYGVDPVNCAVTLNGEPAKLADLKAGDQATLSGQPATQINATRG